ncbi:hypothetical protein [Roseicella sp. DB1501]|nr:hypothetical protein [Roseicella sp. DB1501]
MSLDRCKACCTIVDTDLDDEAYDFDVCLCGGCREGRVIDP